MRSAASCCFLYREGRGRRDNKAIKAPFTVGRNGRDGGQWLVAVIVCWFAFGRIWSERAGTGESMRNIRLMVV